MNKTSILFFFTLIIAIASCRKEDLSLEAKQILQEKKEPLKSNELLEEHGLTFIVRTAIMDTSIINIDLKLYKGSGLNQSTTPIQIAKNSNMNYSVLDEQLENNTEYTLKIEYLKIAQNAPYELFTEGFTSQYGIKELLLTGKSFNTANAGQTKDLMLIKKGILKYAVYEL